MSYMSSMRIQNGFVLFASPLKLLHFSMPVKNKHSIRLQECLEKRIKIHGRIWAWSLFSRLSGFKERELAGHELVTPPHPLEISSKSEMYVRPVGQSPAIQRTPLNWRLPLGNAMLISAENILRITNYFKNATLPWYSKHMGGGSCSWDSN